MEHKEPEWTARNKNRKKGDTTFDICGWCEHASCGTCRYGCYLSTSCSLCRRYGHGHDVKWDTPCVVVKLGKTDFASIIASKEYEIKEAKDKIGRIKTQITDVKCLQQKAFDSPALPDSRRHDYYHIDDVLYVFMDAKWNRGICVSGYRHHDGCVSYALDDYPKSKEGWGCGLQVPIVLKEWEYKYFKANMDRFLVWLDLSDKKYNGEKLDLHSYYQALC